ncbi:response regulator [Desulfobacterales bacterium HSG17]|nr:response regulator [Desulfobacterales bacterium HSG17]
MGAGTIFKFDIPVLQVAEYISPGPKNSPFILAPGQPPHRILIVEDDAFHRLILTIMLKNAGFLVDEAVTGEETIEKYKKYAPDLIWMDLELPDINGLKVTKIIREIETGNSKKFNPQTYVRTPIIALTASSDYTTKNAALTAGCDDFLPKPFHNDEVFQLMQKYLDVQYICEKHNSFRAKQMDHEKIVSEMTDLPSELLGLIEKNIIEGNHKQALIHINDVRALNYALSKILGTMVQQFKYKKLLSLISESRDKTR